MILSLFLIYVFTRAAGCHVTATRVWQLQFRTDHRERRSETAFTSDARTVNMPFDSEWGISGMISE